MTFGLEKQMRSKFSTFTPRVTTYVLLQTVCIAGLIAWSSARAFGADLDRAREQTEPVSKTPVIEGSFVFELENDYVFSSDDNDEFSDTFNTTELALDVHFSRLLSLHTDLIFEPVDNPSGAPRGLREDVFFDDHCLFFETLHLQANIDNISLYGGKINPAFGTAWDVTPGIYGVDFAEDYEITERIGFGAAYTLNAADAGEHTLNAATFFADTSGLSRSFITNRGRTRESDGGASNTESFESLALALDGSRIKALPGFSYHLAFRYQTQGQGDFGDETGVAGGAVQELEINDSATLTLNGEVAFFNNFDGGDSDNLYTTIALALEQDKWFGDAAFSVRDVSSNSGAPDFTDLQFQAGVGRKLFEKASLEVAYRYLREENNDSHTHWSDFRLCDGFQNPWALIANFTRVS